MSYRNSNPADQGNDKEYIEEFYARASKRIELSCRQNRIDGIQHILVSLEESDRTVGFADRNKFILEKLSFGMMAFFAVPYGICFAADHMSLFCGPDIHFAHEYR